MTRKSLAPLIQETLFQYDEALFPLLATGARAMKAKPYAKNQLPDGKFWDPDPERCTQNTETKQRCL